MAPVIQRLTNLLILPSNLPLLASLASAFQLQEYISLLIRVDVHDVDDLPKEKIVTNKRRTYRASGALRSIYLTPLLRPWSLQQECMRAACPEMRAGEWLYLGVVHGSDSAMEVRMCISVKMCIIKGPTLYS